MSDLRLTKEFTVKDEPAFRLRVKARECLKPAGLYSLDFIQECKNKNGEVDFSSTYNFFMTKEDIDKLCEGLQA